MILIKLRDCYAMKGQIVSHPRYRLLIASAVLLGALTGCGSGELRRSLGIDRAGPDAFSVVARAPLESPPAFGLRPPQPGASRPNETNAADRAREALLGPAARAGLADRSPGEAALLTQAGAIGVDPRIRDTVNRESTQLAEADRSFVDRLIFWQRPQAPGMVVNAGQESQRLRDNAALGRPVTEGETPVIQRKRRGPLEGLLPTF
jgi:hypothetical protein